MKKAFGFFISLFLVLVLLSPMTAKAQYIEPTPSPNISIDKLVGKPTVSTKGGVSNLEFVDNLSPSDNRFKAQQEVLFKLKVKNLSNSTLRNVEVKDIFPSSLEAVEGPGSFDAASHTITFNAGDFEPNQEKEFTLKARVLPQNKLPEDKGLFCVINKAQARANGAFDEDTAQLCIEKEVKPIPQVPQAGPELGMYLLGGQLTAFGAGFYLKRKSRLKN